MYPLLTTRAPPLRIKDFVQKFKQETKFNGIQPLEIFGRISKVRSSGKHLLFLDVVESDIQLQVIVNEKHGVKPNFNLKRGDSVSVVGVPFRTMKGQLSLLCKSEINLLSPQLHTLPNELAGATLLKHNRIADLKAFKEQRDVLKCRAFVTRLITQFLVDKDFVNFETPLMSPAKGGANAKTFDFHYDLLDVDLHLRVAPELWLKRLIVAGFDRVFEIGRNFRNEKIDSTHNPEFTTCEFYMSFANLQILMEMTEEMLNFIAQKVKIEFPQYAENCMKFENKFKIVDFTSEIEKQTSEKLSLDLPNLKQLCVKFGINDDGDVPKLLDRLCAHFIESKITTPTFIINHPSVMAPLAKDENNLSKRFELFVDGMEYVNAYEEENDPQQQLRKFKLQNDEVPDMSFVRALEWGLPPTGGWGLGVDRLVMLLTGRKRIGDVLSFGDLNQVRRQ